VIAACGPTTSSVAALPSRTPIAPATCVWFAIETARYAKSAYPVVVDAHLVVETAASGSTQLTTLHREKREERREKREERREKREERRRVAAPQRHPVLLVVLPCLSRARIPAMLNIRLSARVYGAMWARAREVRRWRSAAYGGPAAARGRCDAVARRVPESSTRWRFHTSPRCTASPGLRPTLRRCVTAARRGPGTRGDPVPRRRARPRSTPRAPLLGKSIAHFRFSLKIESATSQRGRTPA
jgi:hypothetical protein